MHNLVLSYNPTQDLYHITKGKPKSPIYHEYDLSEFDATKIRQIDLFVYGDPTGSCREITSQGIPHLYRADTSILRLTATTQGLPPVTGGIVHTELLAPSKKYCVTFYNSLSRPTFIRNF